MIIKTLSSLNNLEDKKVLLRVDFNVSIKDGNVIEDFRIKKVLPTIDFLIQSGAKIILISHIDEKEGGTLEPVARFLLTFFPKLRFIKDIFSPEAKKEVDNMAPAGIILFENLRNWEGEKDNDLTFAKHLASLADIFVNDAFAVSHREHASVVGVPEFIPSYLGLLFEEEIRILSKVFDAPKPFLFIVGGAKFETKLPLIQKFLPVADHIFVGGALANDLFKAKGYFVGDSLISQESHTEDFVNNEKIILPSDVRTQHKGFFYTKSPTEISVNEKIWDIGPKTSLDLKKLINEAKLILWNGPMGNYEQGFMDGTKELASLLTESQAEVIVGGGDVVSCLDKLSLLDKFYFVSTGGGAMLDFLVDETLPGIEAIKKRGTIVEKVKKSIWQKIFN